MYIFFFIKIILIALYTVCLSFIAFVMICFVNDAPWKRILRQLEIAVSSHVSTVVKHISSLSTGNTIL